MTCVASEPVSSGPSPARAKRDPLWARLLWRIAASLGFVGCALLIKSGYVRNVPLYFFGGLGAVVALVAQWLRYEGQGPGTIGWMAWQRCAAACLMLSIVEAGYGVSRAIPGSTGNAARSGRRSSLKPVGFEQAKGDPHAFSEWWNVCLDEWNQDVERIWTMTPNQPVPYLLKPNTSRPFFRGTVSVNSLGLVDREVPFDKGDKFRIVVMGSSHVQCPPIEATDVPWPARLEQLIHERLPDGREIEVLNAGAVAYSMQNNLHRLEHVVLPLKPDMIITYFGYNEFNWYEKDFRLPRVPPPPKKRASKLIGKVEWRWGKWRAGIRSRAEPLDDLDSLSDRLVQCRTARVYEEYFRICREHGIQLVVCNFNMAVDEKSPAEVVAFYEQGFPNVHNVIQANRLNTALLPLIATPESGVRHVDVQEGLDGVWKDNYQDLVHLDEPGRQIMAENLYRGIVDLLPRKEPSPSSSPRPGRVAGRPESETQRF